MIVFRLAKLLTASITARSVILSKALVASSMIRISGSWYSARAIPMRCLWPPDSRTPRSPISVAIALVQLFGYKCVQVGNPRRALNRFQIDS